MKRETEKRLMECVELTSKYASAGSDPNEAIVKAARDTNLRESEIDLVVRAYNTGQTNKTRMNGDDILEKTAEFPLASVDVVKEALYPSTVKTAAAGRGGPSAVSTDTSVSVDYSMSPQTMLERLERREKRAANVDWRTINGQKIEAPEPYPRDPTYEYEQKRAADQRANHAFNEARRQQFEAMEAMRTKFAELGEYFMRTDCTPLPVVKRAAAMLYGEDKTERIFNLLDEHYPHVSKTAANRDRDMTIAHGNEGLELMLDMMRASHEYREKCAAYDAAEAKLPDKSHMKQAAPKVDIYVGSVLDEVPEKVAVAPMSMLGMYGLGSNLIRDTKGLIDGPDPKQLVQQELDQLQDPSHEAQLNEINSEATLHDLLANDPVISGYDPNEAANAYNEIIQTAPAAGGNRMIMQSLLRKRLAQGTVDTFDANQLLDLEKKVRATQPAPAIKGVANDGSVI